MATRSGFSNVDASAAPDRLIAFLDRAADTLAEVKGRMKESLRLDPNARYLDIGCGVGHDIADPRAVGVDLSLRLLREAKRRSPDARVAAADGARLPFADRAFGGCRIERVLMHVPDPDAVLREAFRTLLPSGRIAVWEPDFESLLIDASDVEVSRAVAIAAGARVAQGRVGRELGRRLTTAGFADVDVDLEPGWARSLDDVRRIFALDDVIASLAFEESRTGAWLEELEDRARRGVCLLYFSRFFATARRR